MCLIKVNNILNYNYQSTIIINILKNNNKKNKQQAHKYAMLLELIGLYQYSNELTYSIFSNNTSDQNLVRRKKNKK